MTELYYTNDYGIKIRRCCASCLFKVMDDTKRTCKLLGNKVQPSELCKRWQMAKTYELAGKGGGKVKKKSYLSFSEKVLHNDMTIDAAVTLSNIRSAFEAKNGSIYEELL